MSAANREEAQRAFELARDARARCDLGRAAKLARKARSLCADLGADFDAFESGIRAEQEAEAANGGAREADSPFPDAPRATPGANPAGFAPRPGASAGAHGLPDENVPPDAPHAQAPPRAPQPQPQRQASGAGARGLDDCITEASVAIARLLNGGLDRYAQLGLARDAPVADVDKQYRRLSMLCHPDKCADARATDAFKALAESRAILTDPTSRAAHGALLAQLDAAAARAERDRVEAERVAAEAEIRRQREAFVRRQHAELHARAQAQAQAQPPPPAEPCAEYAQLMRLGLSALKSHCATLGLPVTGNKHQLVSRIVRINMLRLAAEEEAARAANEAARADIDVQRAAAREALRTNPFVRAFAEQELVNSELPALRARLAATLAERDGALAERDATLAERDGARSELALARARERTSAERAQMSDGRVGVLSAQLDGLRAAHAAELAAHAASAARVLRDREAEMRAQAADCAAVAARELVAAKCEAAQLRAQLVEATRAGAAELAAADGSPTGPDVHVAPASGKGGRKRPPSAARAQPAPKAARKPAVIIDDDDDDDDDDGGGGRGTEQSHAERDTARHTGRAGAASQRGRAPPRKRTAVEQPQPQPPPSSSPPSSPPPSSPPPPLQPAAAAPEKAQGSAQRTGDPAAAARAPHGGTMAAPSGALAFAVDGMPPAERGIAESELTSTPDPLPGLEGSRGRPPVALGAADARGAGAGDTRRTFCLARFVLYNAAGRAVAMDALAVRSHALLAGRASAGGSVAAGDGGVHQHADHLYMTGWAADERGESLVPVELRRVRELRIRTVPALDAATASGDGGDVRALFARTKHAWYRLLRPAPSYAQLLEPFARAHGLAPNLEASAHTPRVTNAARARGSGTNGAGETPTAAPAAATAAREAATRALSARAHAEAGANAEPAADSDEDGEAVRRPARRRVRRVSLDLVQDGHDGDGDGGGGDDWRQPLVPPPQPPPLPSHPGMASPSPQSPEPDERVEPDEPDELVEPDEPDEPDELVEPVEPPRASSARPESKPAPVAAATERMASPRDVQQPMKRPQPPPSAAGGDEAVARAPTHTPRASEPAGAGGGGAGAGGEGQRGAAPRYYSEPRAHAAPACAEGSADDTRDERTALERRLRAELVAYIDEHGWAVTFKPLLAHLAVALGMERKEIKGQVRALVASVVAEKQRAGGLAGSPHGAVSLAAEGAGSGMSRAASQPIAA